MKAQTFKAAGLEMKAVRTKQGSDDQGGSSRDAESRNQGMLRGMEKRLGQPKQDGALVDGQSFVLNALKCFGISHGSVSKVEVLDGSMEGKHLVITCTLTVHNQDIPIHVLIDYRAMGIALMDQDFASHHQISHQECQENTQVDVIDRRPIESGDIAHIGKVGMGIQNHTEQLPSLSQ
jgi:hypothetical protein